MKRTSLKRKKGLRKRVDPGASRRDPRRELFKLAARTQRKFCQCREPRRGQAHHVLYEQHARDEGADPHDVRNAMLVCAHCHYAHHQRAKLIPVGVLPEPALEYLHDVLGNERALGYLARYYGG